MTWILLALLAALADAALAIERKRTAPEATALELAMMLSVVTAGAFLLTIPFVWQDIPGETWALIVVRSALNAAATYFLFVALRKDEVSRVIPITALSPMFVVIIEAAWTGRIPSSEGFFGICLVLIGTFGLSCQNRSTTGNWLSPGTLPITMTTALWSVEVVLHGLVLASISPLLYLATSQLLIAALFVIAAARTSKTGIRTFADLPWKKVRSMGIFNIVTHAAQMYAQAIAFSGYVIAIKRMSVIFSVIGAKMFFGEKIASRLPFVALSVIGAIIIVLWK